MLPLPRYIVSILGSICLGSAIGVAATYPDLSKGRPLGVLDARVGANTRLGDDPVTLPSTQRGQAEAHVVRSAANPELLLATFQEGRYSDGGAIGCGYAVSHDGGLTWNRGLIPNLTSVTGGRFLRATDPVAGAGPQGDLYLQNLASPQDNFTVGAVVVSRSTDQGVTWSPPVSVFESTSRLLSPDKNWLAVNDFPGTPASGRLVSTWSNFVSNAAGATTSIDLVSSFSDDRGATWSAPTAITPAGGAHQGTQPVFLPDGSLYVVYVEFPPDGGRTLFNIQGRFSPDGGRTYSATAIKIVDRVSGWVDPVVRHGNFLPSATVSRQSGELFVTYVAVVSGTPRIHVTKSSDRGSTWSRPVVVSDQPAGVSVMNPVIAVTTDGRNVSVVFMDKRHAKDGLNFVDHYAAGTVDGGTTWLPNFRLTELSSDIRYGPRTPGGVMLGDYLGLAPSLTPDQPCVAVWCDTRTGDSDPYGVRFLPAATADFQTWLRAHGLRSATADTDGDGSPELIEFANGTNPRRANSGESLVLRRVNPTTLDLAWTQRPAADLPIVHVAQGDLQLPSPFSPPTQSDHLALPGDLLPSTVPPEGLVWRGVRATLPPDSPATVARFFSPGSNESPIRESEAAANGTDARLVNLSSRARVGPGVSPLIVGFTIDGNKSILVRATGPTLTALGVEPALAEPRLTLSAAASGLVLSNDRWQQGGATAELFSRLGAFAFSAGSRDAALALALGAQGYTAIVSAANDGAGIALAEIYDADNPAGSRRGPRLINLSTRGTSGEGHDALIAGLVIAGTQPRRVLIRAVGPTLASLGVTETLPDPVLTLYRGSVRIASNDDWEISRSAAALAEQAVRLGAFPLAAESLDAALLITLAPGAYTVVVTGADGRSGVALVEVYDAD